MKRPLVNKGLHLHFDPASGIAGDMTVAALVDAGVPRAAVVDAIDAMGVRGLTVRFERRRRGAFVGTGFVVEVPDERPRAAKRANAKKKAKPSRKPNHHDHHDAHAHTHRDYADIRRLLKRARLDPDVRDLAAEIFAAVAAAESALHGTPLDRIAFHEVGAYDSIADIVGAAAAIAHLAPSAITSSPPVLGTGVVRTAHGLVPVPAPATAALLHEIPVRAEGHGELTTPTGAAILATVVDQFGALPPVRLAGQGFGAGTRELADRPNVLRVILGQALGQALSPSLPEAVLLESNIDDMSPQLVEPLLAALFAAGALDAWATPILMKKGRPALTVSALGPPEAVDAVARAFFENSTTIGLRTLPLGRVVLARSSAAVKTSYGKVAIKLSALDGQVVSATPEFEDCRRLARAAGVPVRAVLAAATAAAAFDFGMAGNAGKR